MSLSDCPQCWDTPCCCGYQFKEYGVEGMAKYILGIMKYYTMSQKKEIIAKVINTLMEIEPKD